MKTFFKIDNENKKSAMIINLGHLSIIHETNPKNYALLFTI